MADGIKQKPINSTQQHFDDGIESRISKINSKFPEGNRTSKNKKIKYSERRDVMIEAKQPFMILYKYDLVVLWQCVDIGREVNKVKSIILSKISCNIYCDSDTAVLTGLCLKDLIVL